MKAVKVYALAVMLVLAASVCMASEAVTDPDLNGGSSRRTMESIEKIIYGYESQGGLIERLARVEEDLFGRSLPGTLAERYTAILNFIDIGTEEQPSMMFKLGVAEWVVDKRINASMAAAKRLENLEINLTGSPRTGSPIVMRVESLLATLIMDPVTAQPITLPANTVMKFRFMDELSPATSKVGDSVRLELTNDLIVNQHLVAPAGSLLLTEVREVKRPRMFGIPGEVRLTFSELEPLGPQRPLVTVGDAAQKAIKDARKTGDRGEGAIVGAGALSIAGAALLGPAGLVSGVFIRGNSIKIAAGSVTFVQTAEDITVSAYPIPISLQSNIPTLTPQDDQVKASSYSTAPSQTAAPSQSTTSSQTTTTRVSTISSQSTTQRASTASTQSSSSYDPDRDTIIKGDVFNRGTYGAPTNSGTVTKSTVSNTGANKSGNFDPEDDFMLPPEQGIN